MIIFIKEAKETYIGTKSSTGPRQESDELKSTPDSRGPHTEEVRESLLRYDIKNIRLHTRVYRSIQQ